MDINGDCQFRGSHLENTDHLFRRGSITKDVWFTAIDVRATHINSAMQFLEWIDWI